jgi:hypothetical protein
MRKVCSYTIDVLPCEREGLPPLSFGALTEDWKLALRGSKQIWKPASQIWKTSIRSTLNLPVT